MQSRNLLQLGVFLGALVAITPVLGHFMARVFAGGPHALQRPLGWMERAIYKLSGIDPSDEMSWGHYAFALLAFNIIGALLLLVLQMTQTWLPLNPQHFAERPLRARLQHRHQLHDEHELAGVFRRSHHELLHADGRTGRAQFRQRRDRHRRRRSAHSADWCANQRRPIGNFWTDLTRCTLYVLLPLSILFTVVLVQQGVVQTFDGLSDRDDARGRVTNHPARAGGLADRDQAAGHQRRRILRTEQRASIREPDAADQLHRSLRHLLRLGSGACLHVWRDGARSPPGLGDLGRDVRAFSRRLRRSLVGGVATQPCAWPNDSSLEGKKFALRINSTPRSSPPSTTDASCGAVNAMHDSLSPLGGLVPLMNMMLGEVIFGGVGAGPLRDADVRSPDGFHRRTHGRPHPGISRQENRSARSQLGRRRGARACGRHSYWHRPDDDLSGGAQQSEQRRTSWLERSDLRLHLRRGE